MSKFAKFKDTLYDWAKQLPENSFVQISFEDSHHVLRYSTCSDVDRIIATLRRDEFINQLDLAVKAIEFAAAINTRAFQEV